MALSDVKVRIDLVNPASRIGLGTPLILAKSDQASVYTEYHSIGSVQQRFGEDSEVYALASAIFGQGDNSPNKLAVATFGATAEDDSEPLAFGSRIISSVRDALDAYFDRDWHFMLFAETSNSEKAEAAKFIEGKDFKFPVVHATELSELAAFKDLERTVLLYHPIEKERIDAALVGACGSQTVGSITWKFKQLRGITAQPLTNDDVIAIHEAGAIAYVTKAGDPQTSEGKTAGGEYIDNLHGIDWIKANLETNVQKAFTNNSKIPYTSEGISLLETVATDVLQTASSAEYGIVALDEEGIPQYTVSTLAREEVPAADRKDRVYRGLSFSFQLAGAIHQAEIKGEILI